MTHNFLIKNIGSLYMHSREPMSVLKGLDMARVPVLDQAWVKVSGGLIEEYGSMDSCPEYSGTILDARGGILLPAFVDAHTHLVFAETREQEFVDRIRGLSYQEISARGGGILNSAAKLAGLSEDDLFERSLDRLQRAQSLGTCSFEIKSGYGLAPEQEIKMLRVIRRLAAHTGLPIRSTFLGAHSYPLPYRENHRVYLDQLIRDMLPAIAEEGLADYIDVFCEKGFFSPEETGEILEAGIEHGLIPRIHTNQFTSSGGIDLAIQMGARSVDHLEVLDDREIALLADSEVFPVLLPLAAFFMNLHDPPARRMIEAGLPLVIASDYNPGTSPSPDMNLIFALSCIRMRLLPEEVLAAMTLNAAYALDLQDSCGSITPGKKALFILSKPGVTLDLIPYSLGASWIRQVIPAGI